MISILTTQYDAKLEPLKEAVESGNSDFLRRWLEEGQPICNPESKRESLLSVAFYEDIVGRGKAVVNHRLARDFIDELAKRWQAEGGLTKGRQEWLDKANAILEKRDPYKVNA